MRVAIVKLSAMGDIIHAMVALEYIKKANPSLHVDWVVEESFASLLEGNPHIDNILRVKLKAIKKDKKVFFVEYKKVREYAKNSYDLVIDAQGLLKSAMVSKLLGGKVAGFSKESIREKLASYFYAQKVDIAYSANTIDRNMAVICQPLGLHVSPEMILEKKPFLYYEESLHVDEFLSKKMKNIVFVIGSTWESRNYPKEKFLEIANELKENSLICWGTQEERSRAEWIEKNSSYAKALPKMDLNQLKEVIAKSDLLIGNDTGPTHMAWGFNVPSITIFGPTPVNRVYETDINLVVKSNSEVNPYKLDKNDFSIKDIDSKEIVKMAKRLL